MKLLYKYIITGLCATLLFTFTACNKWLDVKPSSEIKEKDLFSTERGFQDALTGVYTQLTSREQYGDNLTMGLVDVMAQRYAVQVGNSLYRPSIYDYQDQQVKTTIQNIWGGMYNTVVNVNKILENIEGQRSIFTSNNYDIIKGEALGLRAMIHFDLLRLFGPGMLSNPTKPAIPYIKQVSLKITPLSTVTATLDLVIADLRMSDSLLSVYPVIDDILQYRVKPTTGLNFLAYRQNRFNYWAAKAMLARAYLYKRDKPNALKYALEVINSGKFNFITSSALTVDNAMRDRTYIPEHIFSLYVSDLKAATDQYFRIGANSGIGPEQLTNSPDFFRNEVFEGQTTDFRLAYGFETSGATLFPSRLWQLDATLDIYKSLLPLIRLPEMYYIAAEATTDLPDAISYLNKVRANRGISPLPAGLPQSDLQREIFKEYRKEFFCEGQLFFYYKRLNAKFIEGTSIAGSDKIYVLPLSDNELQFGNR
jgi:DNA-binding NarL/FixJ family response regulator